MRHLSKVSRAGREWTSSLSCKGVLWPEAGAESTPVPAFGPELLPWDEANRQANRERMAWDDGWRVGFTLAKLPANTRNAGNRSRAGGW